MKSQAFRIKQQYIYRTNMVILTNLWNLVQEIVNITGLSLLRQTVQ